MKSSTKSLIDKTDFHVVEKKKKSSLAPNADKIRNYRQKWNGNV